MLSKLRTRLRALLRKSEIERELDEELRLHIEQQIEQNILLGMNPEEARYAARRAFGGVEQAKERSRDARGVRWLEELWQDLRYGARMMIKRPGFTAVAVVTLALGIGANTAIFSVAHAVMWRPLPYQRPEQLVMVWERSTREKMAQPSPNEPALFLAWRENKEFFSDIAAYEDAAISHSSRFYLTGGNEPERIMGAYVSGNLFSLLGVNAALGRTFMIEDEQPGRGQVVILSDAFWRRRFGADPDVIGKTIRLSDKVFTVAGVAPAEFKLSYPNATELWAPLTFGPKEKADWEQVAYKVVARLKPGVTIANAREAMTRLTQRLEAPHKKSVQDLYVQLDPLHEYYFGETRRPLLLLLAAVVAVLLIACVNVANLSLARAMDRGREIALRAAMGASRGRLIRQMLTESLMLGAIGGVVGVALAFWGRDLLVGLMPSAVPRSGDVKIDAWALGFTALLSISAGVISGVMPALQASKPELNETLKAGSRSATAQSRARRWRDGLVVVETALSLLLLAGAGLMIRSLWRLHHVELGFDPKNVLTMRFTIPPYKFTTDRKQKRAFIEAQERAFTERVVERIKTTPGVVSVAAASSIPLRGVDYFCGFGIDGKPSAEYGARCRSVSNNYFRTMGVRLLKGRTFNEQDTAQSGSVAVVTEEFARRFFANEEPLGQRLNPFDAMAVIVGVVADVRHKRPEQALEPAVYVPLSQGMSNPYCLVVRAEGDPSQLSPAIRRAVWAEDQDLPLEEVATMEQITANAISDSRFISIALGVFALIALLLGATGIYGVISHSVAGRTREIGVRTALGAQRPDLLWLVLAQGLKLALIGVALGLIAAFGLTRLMKSLLFGVSATDPLTFAAITALLVFVALLACWIPARRATKVDPVVALRCD
ncbi:MAG TPA: ABC transporter permease [Blastocatellia bacterium]|jgi:putative ABC transport system permease protein|nr:ABC transporter permease [Blastocatellia bacterium]